MLAAVRESDAYANLLLPARLGRARLDARDAAFATELTYGTLRMRGLYDRVIALAADRDADEIDPPVLDVLRLGTHQLLALATPPFAAVDASVALTRAIGAAGASGFVNGVLRRISRSTPDEWRDAVRERAADADEALAAVTAHPAWIVRAFRRALAAEGAADELDALLEADDAAPAVTWAALPSAGEAPAGARPDDVSPVGFTLPRTGAADAERGEDDAPRDPARLVASSGGTLRVQDAGSQLAALALSRARDVRSGERWLDVCSGPGGKAALLAAEAREHGATLVANELAPARLDLVARAVAPVADVVELTRHDGRDLGRMHPGAFDRILLDAPCSGLGALRRRPESRWRRTPSDVAGLVRLQGELLASAAEALAPGGLLAYVTCSPHLPETRSQVADVLHRHPELALVDTVAVLDAIAVRPVSRRAADAPGGPSTMQLWPHRHGTDAMFIALITKEPRS